MADIIGNAASTAHVYPEGCYFKTIEDIKDKHVTIMGLGLNGGGEACVKFFLRHGAYVLVTDLKSRQELEPTILSLTMDKTLNRSRLSYVFGEHRVEDFANADCVIKNPGVKYEGNKYLAAAKAVETDMSIFLHFCKAPIIAVTGSKGKSSTASAIAYGMKQSGFRCFLGGNIALSPLSFLEDTDGTTPVVLELSSWQLRDLRGRKVLKPKIAIITTILPDHQNWYDGMDSYVADKRLIYENQDADDYTILSADEDGYMDECQNKHPECKCWGDDFALETRATVFRYSKVPFIRSFYGAFLRQGRAGGAAIGYSYLPVKLRSRHGQQKDLREEEILGELAVPGDIMRMNALVAALALQLQGIAPLQIKGVLAQWPGLPYRMEACHSWTSPSDKRPVVFYNDSCATVPEAAAAATQAFKRSVIYIGGGTDKNLDFFPLAQALHGNNDVTFKPKDIYLLEGTGTEKLRTLLDARHVSYRGPFASIRDLLLELRVNLKDPDARKVYGPVSSKNPLPIVFSPGATSFGMFANEFDRGEQFKKQVRDLFF